MKPDKSILQYTLKQLNNNKDVEKIIIISNVEGFSRVHETTEKMKVFEDINMYVNPAWNFGVNICNSEYYLLLNDDVLCDSTVIDQAIYLLDNNNKYNVLFVETKQEDEASYIMNVPNKGVINFVNATYIPRACLSGCFIIGRKKIWIPIPEELKIFYGDDWIIDHNTNSVGKILTTYVSHVGSVTARDRYKDKTLDNEGKIYAQIKLQGANSGYNKS